MLETDLEVMLKFPNGKVIHQRKYQNLLKI